MTGQSQHKEGYAPCPTCKQYNHSIDEGLVGEAILHFTTIEAHPVRGTPMGPIFDEKTIDMARRIVARIGALEEALTKRQKRRLRGKGQP